MIERKEGNAMQTERLTLVLSPGEMAALRKAAQAELRRPRDQARAILRDALLRADQEKHNDAVMNFGETHGAVAATAG
jgi:hypothetical protein